MLRPFSQQRDETTLVYQAFGVRKESCRKSRALEGTPEALERGATAVKFKLRDIHYVADMRRPVSWQHACKIYIVEWVVIRPILNIL